MGKYCLWNSSSSGRSSIAKLESQEQIQFNKLHKISFRRKKSLLGTNWKKAHFEENMSFGKNFLKFALRMFFALFLVWNPSRNRLIYSRPKRYGIRKNIYPCFSGTKLKCNSLSFYTAVWFIILSWMNILLYLLF